MHSFMSASLFVPFSKHLRDRAIVSPFMHGFLAHMLQLDHEDQDANDDEDVVEALPDVVGLNDLEEGDGADPQFILL